jgi:hypothetical protein
MGVPRTMADLVEDWTSEANTALGRNGLKAVLRTTLDRWSVVATLSEDQWQNTPARWYRPSPSIGRPGPGGTSTPRPNAQCAVSGCDKHVATLRDIGTIDQGSARSDERAAQVFRDGVDIKPEREPLAGAAQRIRASGASSSDGTHRDSLAGLNRLRRSNVERSPRFWSRCSPTTRSTVATVDDAGALDLTTTQTRRLIVGRTTIVWSVRTGASSRSL